MVKNLYRFIARIERVVYYCDSSILLCLHGSPRDPARGHPSLSQACVTHWPICMCNMYCASPRIFKDARATKNYDVLKCLWVASGFAIRIGTDAPRRVKAATREGHPAPWLAGELDPRGAQSEEAPGFSFIWSCSVRYSRHPAAYVPPEREPRRRAASTRERMSATGGPATRVVSSSLSALFFVRFAFPK